MSAELFSIGGYGYTVDSFVTALLRHDIKLFVDVRQRRGMRGSRYAFLNATALQSTLADAGINYVHLKGLAPTAAIRQMQSAADLVADIGKRQRTSLSHEFRSAYREQILAGVSAGRVMAELGSNKRICFFCVEAAADACHRSLICDWLRDELGLSCTHIEHRTHS